MHIHNHKIINIILIIVLTPISIYGLNTSFNNKQAEPKINISSGALIASTSPESPLINISRNENSEKIQKIIFNNNKANSVVTKSNSDNINNYLINIFCSETTSKYIKVASGSGVFLSNPDDEQAIILTNAHVARHLLDSNKKCVGRTKSPTTTTHTLTLRYIPSYWLANNDKYVIGDPDQNSTGEFDFAIIESKKIKKTVVNKANVYEVFKTKLKLKISNYENQSLLDNVYIYSYPARKILSKNVNNPLFQKKDIVKISNVYSSPTDNTSDSLLDVVGSQNIDHGSSGGMVTIQGQNNYLIGLSSVLIKDNNPQIVRVVTLKHVLNTIKKDLMTINNAQADPFLMIIEDMLNQRDFDMSMAQIFKNIKFTSVLEQYTKETLANLNIIRR